MENHSLQIWIILQKKDSSFQFKRQHHFYISAKTKEKVRILAKESNKAWHEEFPSLASLKAICLTPEYALIIE